MAMTSVGAVDSRIENALQWAVDIANDADGESHGYSWDGRWGTDYDCSSLVITAFKNSGFNVGSATYTGNMRTVFEEAGFTWIPKTQINLSSSSQLQRGDILLNESSHTEIYLGNGQNVGAHRGYMSQWCSHSNSDGKYHRHGHYSLGEQKGDQDGGEISVAGYYNYPWDGILRYTPQEPEIKYWYENLELVNLGDNFSARIRNVALDVLLTNFNGNVVVGKHYDYKIARQIWNFTRNSDGSYKIKSCLNDYCMELHNFDDFDGGNITCIPSNGSTAQDWFIYLNSDGSYSMRPKCSNERVIDVRNGDPTDGNNLQLWNYLSNDNQKFSIEKCGQVVNMGDVFAASIEHTDYWKPIYQSDTGNVELTTSSRDKMSGILWYFDRDEENGWYTITSYKNAKCLEVENNSTEPGANVQCGDYVGNHGQHWYILKSIDSEGTEYHYFKSACSSNNLDLDYNLEADGTNIKMWTLNSSDAQKYSIYKIQGETSYSISAMNKNIELGDTTDIIINDTTFVTSYKFHIIAPDGTESVVNNNCNYIYKFKPNQTGRYIIYGEVESPVSKDIGSITDKSVEITVLDHYYTSNVTKSATCTESGIKTYTCSTCGDTYTETIPATGHSWKSATCTSKKTCATCGVTEGSALGHSYTSKVTKQATCTANGTKTFSCSRCAHTYTEIIPATGHSWKSATCTSKKTCTTCGVTEGSALGHSYTSKVTKQATCTASGTKTFTCSRCTHSYTETIPAIGHSWKSATCTSKKTCSTCGITEGSALGHNYTSKVTKQATCTASGIKTFTCSRCNHSYTETIPATGHSWKSATCTSKKTCATCGVTEGSALGHSYTSKVTKQATCTASGTKTFSCSRCTHSYTETIPATGHKIVIDDAVPPTATESGLTQGEHCGVCGKVLIPQEVIKPIGIIGDIDGDGEITIKDATTLQKHLADLIVLDDKSLTLADANGDGIINISDSTQIQKYLVNLIEKLG